MPVKFSEKYNLKKKDLLKEGVFDVILDIDTRVFIDPAMLDICSVNEFKGARRKIERYFSDIIILIRHSKNEGDMFWRKADELLAFRELSGTCFGYSEKGTRGNAIGKKLRTDILHIIKELISEGEDDPLIFELLGVFQEDVGCDRISDLITYILRHEILSYSQRVVEHLGISSEKYIYEERTYNVCINPFNDKILMLLPNVLLSPLPIAESFDDIDFVCSQNRHIREIINSYFDFERRKKFTKKELKSLFVNNNEFRKAIIDVYRKCGKQAYDFSTDPIGEYIWLDMARDYTKKYPLRIDKNEITEENIVDVVKTICYQFKGLIEDNGLNALLFDTNGNAKHESAAQLLFFGIADSYCIANDLDLIKEGNNGRGPVDFKLSHGNKKIIVEIKLTSNPQLKHGVDKQIPIYMKQEKTQHAIYLIIDTGNTRQLDSFINTTMNSTKIPRRKSHIF